MQDFSLSYTDALMHFIKGNVGSGIFAMGDAVKNSGMILGPILISIIGVISLHCMHLLSQVSRKIHEKDELPKKMGYARTVEWCFFKGPPTLSKYSAFMKKAVNSSLIFTQLGFCCVYFIFITDNLHQVASYYEINLDFRNIMDLIFVPVVLPCLIRNLKFLSPISMTANILMITGTLIVFYYILSDGMPPIYTRNYIAGFKTLPLFFGTAIFCFGAIAMVLPVQNEMRNPEDFYKPMGVLNVGMFIVAVLHIGVGFLGYWKFGEEVSGSVTLNLPQDQILYQIVKLMISLGVLLTYCLQLFIVVKIMWPFILSRTIQNNKHPVIWELLFRMCLVLLTYLLAQSIPFLNLFVSLVGAVCSAALALLFPPLADLVLKYTYEELTKTILIKNVSIILFSLSGMVTGGYMSISSIVIAIQERDENLLIESTTNIFNNITESK